jgi:spermidine synthase
MRFRAAVLVCALSGFHALSYEVAWFRYYSLGSGSSPSAFGVLLGFYLAGIAFGSAGAGLMLGKQGAALRERSQAALASASLCAAVLAFSVLPSLAVCRQGGHWLLAHVMIALAAAAMGIVMPLVCQLAVAADSLAGSRVSYLYIANIIGSALGSLLTGLCWFEFLGPVGVSRLLFSSGVGITLLLLSAFPGSGSWVGRLQVAAVGVWILGLVAAPLGFRSFHEKLMFGGPWPTLERVIENRHGIIAVDWNRVVYGGGVYDGRISTDLVRDSNGILRAYAVAALHPKPERVLVVGLSAGAWTRVISQLPGVAEVDVVEINPGYLELIRSYPEVAPLLDDPRVHVFIDDGRRWLIRHPDAKYDFIVQNTTFHWRAHATLLLSREYFDLCRRHLLPGGLLSVNTTGSAEVYRTAATAFRYALRVNNLVVGGDQPFEFSRERWHGLLTTGAVGSMLRGAPEQRRRQLEGLPDSWGAPEEGAVLESREAILERTARASIITDDNMASEWKKLRVRWQ